MKRRMNTPRAERRGAALLIVLILIAVLTGGTLAMVNLATTDVDIAIAGRQEAISFAVAESALDEVLTDGRTKIEADPFTPGVGFSPNPDHPTLSAQYPNNGTPITTLGSGGQATAFVRLVRTGPTIMESSTQEAQAVVFDVAVTGDYLTGAGTVEARREVGAEFYKFAPKPSPGILSRSRHYQ